MKDVGNDRKRSLHYGEAVFRLRNFRITRFSKFRNVG